MAGPGFVTVKVVAIRVGCDRCGERVRVQHDHEDGFTRQVLQPLKSWWSAHYAPRVLMFEVVVDGEHRQWAAAG